MYPNAALRPIGKYRRERGQMSKVKSLTSALMTRLVGEVIQKYSYKIL